MRASRATRDRSRQGPFGGQANVAHANANSQRLMELLGSFHPDWRRDIEGVLVDNAKAAVDSVVVLRNSIAHGVQLEVKKVVAHIAMLCGA